MKHPVSAQRLLLAMSNLHMSQQELSDKSGVSKASISQYCNGSHSPSNFSSAKLGEVLHVNPLWLMEFDVPMNVSEAFSSTDPKLVAKFMMDNKAKELLNIYLQLSEDDKKSILDLAEFLYQKSIH